MYTAMFLFSLALSMDGFGVGLSYGMQKIRIGAASFLVICLSSALAVTVSMLAGNLVTLVLSISAAKQFGALILIAVGAWLFVQNLTLHVLPDGKILEVKTLNMRVIVNILKEPGQADADRSGSIDVKEAFVLGVALAIDAFAAGFAASLSGFDPYLTPLFVGLAKLLLVSAGLKIGSRCAVDRFKGKATLLPGCIILGLGLFSFIGL